MTLRLDGIVLRSDLLERAGVGHAFTTRLGGVSGGRFASLNLAPREGEPPENVARNREIACAAAGADASRLATCRQVLGADVVVASLERRPEGDALVSGEPGLPTMTLSADCNLVLLYDPRRRAVGNAHASRAGTRGGIVGRTVAEMRTRFGSDPSDLVAVVGPSIGPCCYTIGGAVLADWQAWAPRFLDGARLDLKAANRAQLVESGVRADNIDVSDLCTRCRGDWFYSYRRDGEASGRFGALIWLEPEEPGRIIG